MKQYRVTIISAEVVRDYTISADKYQKNTHQGVTTITFMRDEHPHAEFIVGNYMSVAVFPTQRSLATDD